MRKGYEPVLILDGGKAIGVVLGSDFCAEHEWGIEGIQSSLGMPHDIIAAGKLGIDGRKITKFPEKSFAVIEIDGYQVLIFNDVLSYLPGKIDTEWYSRELQLSRGEPLCAAWCDNSFAVALKGNCQEFIKQLFEAFNRKDVCIWLSGGEAFKNAGLTIVIASAIPQDFRESMQKSDESQKRLRDAVKASGIEEKLRKAGKKYYALSPQWADESETQIRFWLNPCGRENAKANWYTLQDLLDWIENIGPIPVSPDT